MTTDQTTPRTPRTDATAAPAGTTIVDRWIDHAIDLGRTVARSRVAQAVLAMTLLHLGLRTWATAISWFASDDFAFMSRMWTEGASLNTAIQPYGGHVMPAGMGLTWLTAQLAPYDWTLAGGILVGMQVLADIGAVVLLVRLFGLRPGILPPLALYYFTVFSTPMAVWWAAAVNQVPFQVVLFWSLASHVSYLRTRRVRHLATALAWVIVGLAFYEKTVLVLGGLGIVTLAYFTAGSLWARLRETWRLYKPALLAYVVVGGAYLVAYAVVGLNFGAAAGGNFLVGSVAANMAVDAYSTGLVGGPLRWDDTMQSALADPSPVTIVASLAVIALVVRALHRTRLRSLRAWWLPAFFLFCDVALVLAGRATLVGDLIALEYRYQSELGAVTAIALALASLPVRGAHESVEIRQSSRLLSHPARVAALVTVVSVLGTVSAAHFARHWAETNEGKSYFDHALPTIQAADFPIPLVDGPVPNSVIWGILYPVNLQSRVLTPFADHLDFRTQAVDRLMVISPEGRVEPAAVPPVRTAVPGPVGRCGYRLRATPQTIRLNGPLAYGGWWVRVGYLSSASTEARITAGDATYDLDLPAGVHAVYVAAKGDFESITMSISDPDATVCTDDVSVGRPEGVGTTP